MRLVMFQSIGGLGFLTEWMLTESGWVKALTIKPFLFALPCRQVDSVGMRSLTRGANKISLIRDAHLGVSNNVQCLSCL